MKENIEYLQYLYCYAVMLSVDLGDMFNRSSKWYERVRMYETRANSIVAQWGFVSIALVFKVSNKQSAISNKCKKKKNISIRQMYLFITPLQHKKKKKKKRKQMRLCITLGRIHGLGWHFCIIYK